MSTPFNKFILNANLHKYEENKKGFYDTNYKADMNKVERRRKREAFLEAKELKSLDPLDDQWQDMWSSK